MFPVLFVACSVTRLYFILFNIFWVLYLTSFVGANNIFKSDKEVSIAYARLMLCSAVVAIIFSPLIGFFADKVSPRITLPISFLLRAFAILLFYFIEDPTQPYAYVVGTFLVVGSTCEQICTDSILMRNADREIRGLILGTAVAFGYLGKLILCLVGGWLFDHVGPKTPFWYVGALDLLFSSDL